MSSRPVLKPQLVFNNTTLAATISSLITNINMIPIVSYTVVWTGSPTGTLVVQVCNDYVPSPGGVLIPPVNAGSWKTLTTPSSVSLGGAGGSTFLDVPVTAAAWIKLLYTSSSGTGNINATLAGKVY